MWIFLNDAFLSIVDDREKDGHLVVRARRPGDIEKTFPGVKTKTLRGRDYQFRAHVPREMVAEVISKNVMNIDYSNFKNSISTENDDLHTACGQVWHIMARLQPKPPYRM
jgi:hypothetical protein